MLTGAGEVVTTKPGDELFDAFPNSYGSLGYATRLRIALEPVQPYVALRHVRFPGAAALAEAVTRVVEERAWDGERVDAVDGVAFAPDELYLTLARWTDDPGPTSDYAGQQVFYRSLQERSTDRLTMHDYLWRWDTDWFWCSRAFGAQHPVVRRVWPRRLRRGADGSGDRPWPGYPLSAATTYVNVGFWGIVNVGPDAPSSPRNRVA